jgi:[protein-PII] uridylyltransferase
VAALLGDEPGVALVAVGGYGRRELAPGSDVDLVLLHGGRRDIGAVAERVWYPLWDARLKVGHGVRTVKEAAALAAGDLEVATSMLAARRVAGDPGLVADLVPRVHAAWRRRARRWLPALAASVARRHTRFGEVAFHLEPDLKEGRGGLRDVHALWWAQAAALIDLPLDPAALQEAYDVLLAARVELHRRTGRATDVLLLQEQDAVAAALGLRDADALMAAVASAARGIAWASDEAWWRIESSLRGPVRNPGRERRLGGGLVLRDGSVELEEGADASDPATVLRAGLVAAQAGARLGMGTLDRFAAGMVPPPDPWPAAVREALVALLATGRPAVGVLEALDQRGLLVRLLPEWAAVRCRPQRNAYHRFTVDRHLCEAAAEAAALMGRVDRPDLLLLAAWLHDIGKGHGGDHVATGEAIVRAVATRMGLPGPDVELLATLVRHHLLLADIATRRDIDDPATVEAVAAVVGDRGVLELLHALTEADSIATGPAAWGAWKAGLVAGLVARVEAVLAGGSVPAGTEPLTPAQQELVARVREQGDVAVEHRDGSLTVVAPDRPGLFCRVAGTLTLHGLNVLAAKAFAADRGIAVETFVVEPAHGGDVDWSALAADVRRALSGRLSLEARLAERARQYAGLARPRAAVPARRQVFVDNDASAAATVIEVRAPDAPGTLYRITRALAECDLDIRYAKVQTLGHEVVDAFYVVDRTGAKVTDPEFLGEIERAVLVELERV